MGLALALSTSAFWACGNVVIQKTGRAVGAARAMLWAMVVGALLSGIAAVFDTRTAPITGASWAWVTAASVAGLCAYALLFYAFERAPLMLATPLVSSWPLTATVLSMVAFGEQIHAQQGAGAAVVLLGVVMVSVGAGGGPRTNRSSLLPLLAALGSGVSFGIMIPAMARVSPEFGAFGTSAIVYAVGVGLALVLALAVGVPLGVPPKNLWMLVLLTGVVETAGFVTLTLARARAPMVVVGPIASLASTFTVVYGWLWLRERPGRLAAVGAVVACAGVILLAL